MPPMEPLLVLLRVAKEVSAGIPFPGLSAALKIALTIAEKAKEIEDIRDECRLLAERAAYFSLRVYDQMKQSGRDSAPSITAEEHIELLLCTLRDIESLMKRRRKIRALSFLWRHMDIAEEVRKLSIQLEDAIRLFVMQTGVETQQRLNALASSNTRLLQHVEDSARVGDIPIGETRNIRSGVLDLAQRISGGATFDGRFRLFAQENLHLVEPISEANPLGAFPRQADEHDLGNVPTKLQTARVIRYRAVVKAAGELSGSQVIVHMYPDGDNGRFVEAVKSAKQTYHPYILAMLGYSRPGDPGEASYIVTEDYHPFINYLSSFHGTKKLRVFIQMTSEMCYTLGAWVGRNHDDKPWSVLPARSPWLEVDQTFERVPYINLWKSSPPDALAELSRHADDEGEEYFSQKMRMYKPLDVPGLEHVEIYQFNCVSLGTTYLFRQRVHISDRGNAVLRLLRSASDLPAVGYKSIGILSEYVYYTETTAASAAEQAPPPLWFFMLQADDGDHRRDAVCDGHMPCGFWSSDKHPASIPAGIDFDPTLRLERIGRDNDSAPVSTWTQRIADLTFTMQTKMYITIVELSEDERSAAREPRENSCLSSACRDPDNADCSATYDDRSDDGANREAAGRFDLSDGDSEPAAVPSISAGSEP
ncbi:uncharacterized protein TRAVEDRAFT_54300 [Trametes versicolor FP-101664 SS1]|uniref:Uncharacterized protein n=1 Tax=Trametes versicolor (strain FP-101664) TaxID=717944 RepID=R7S7D3_TRAVS|nr:uncharacterized protein TRAVEDRAFT_54300 [Trametes versicolor FP-101664 SS1]EIW51881.1 hypothetical protein TRAVEDRAFT_54300 [Trametes versicolor FP-101664 SS1]